MVKIEADELHLLNGEGGMHGEGMVGNVVQPRKLPPSPLKPVAVSAIRERGWSDLLNIKKNQPSKAKLYMNGIFLFNGEGGNSGGFGEQCKPPPSQPKPLAVSTETGINSVCVTASGAGWCERYVIEFSRIFLAFTVLENYSSQRHAVFFIRFVVKKLVQKFCLVALPPMGAEIFEKNNFDDFL